MSDGPTTVGSIVAKLKMDRAQWVADVAATKAEARELGSLDPNIHIDDNAGQVVAHMATAAAAVSAVGDRTDKVTIAQGRLTAAMSAADSAYARANLAQMRLNELREKGVAEGSRLAAAELAASESMKRLDAANDKVTASDLRLAAARRVAAEAAGDEERAVIRANEANKTSVTRVGAIVTAIALLVPLLAPVGAAAVGLAGGLGLMGAAGVLAIFGIIKAMKDGTQTGNAYAAGLNTLKGTFTTLSNTAAVKMLSSFQRVVQETTDALPFLNKQVGQFSTLLGNSGANAVTGVINSLRVMNPLFQTAGLYLQSLTAGFQRWTEGSGIEEFTGYALASLPMVVDVLGKLASAVMHILEALAPLGTVGLAVLSGIADVISSIPVDVLSQLIVSITWGAIAFKAWGFVAPMLTSIATSMGAVGVATTIATGPIGWVIAGLAALAGIFAVTIASNTGATRAMQDYTAAVQADSGAIGENIRQKTAQKLLDSGALDAARQLGISTSLVVDATLNEVGARQKLSNVLDPLNAKLGTYSERKSTLGNADQVQADAVNLLTGAMQEQGGAVEQEVGRYKMLQEALAGAVGATTAQQWADQSAAAALGISAQAVTGAREAQAKLEDSTAKATAQMYLQGDAAGLLKQQLDALNGKTLSAEEAQNRFESQLTSMNTHIDTATGAIDANAASLDGMSASAVANRGELIGLVTSAQNSAQAFRDQGGSADETKAKLQSMKDEIVNQAVANGANRDSVQQYIDKLFQIPDSIPPTKLEVDKSFAEQQVALFIAQTSAEVAWINVRATMPDLNGAVSGNGRPGVALGGTIRGLAGGGSGGTVVGPGTAGSDTAGLFRLGNGEEVVSNVFGQADRWRATIKQMNAGVAPPQITGGGTSTAPAASTAPAQVNVFVNVSVLKNEDPAVVGNQVGRGVKNALAGVKL